MGTHSTMNCIASTCLFLGLAFLLVGLEATPQGKGRGIGRAPSAIVNCGCQCSNIMYRDEDGKVHGNCKSADDSGAQWCYVGAGSTCQDIQTSDKGPHGDDWSYEACATPVCEVGAQLKVWRKVFSHNASGGLFSDLDDAKRKNIDDNEADLFSILYDLESMRNEDGVFHFKLCYPDLTEYDPPCNEWKQSSNPLTESKITGYSAIAIAWPKNSINKEFGGLGLSPPSFRENLIDDAPEHAWWHCSIGSLKHWGGSDTIPGPQKDGQRAIKRVELHVL